MLKRLLVLILICIFLIISIQLPSAAAQNNRMIVSQTCYAEIQLEHWVNMRAGPALNYAVVRNLAPSTILRIFGEDGNGEWFHAYLPRVEKVGWIFFENVSFFGNCTNLPVTNDDLDLIEPPSAPPDIELPDYADGMEFVEGERIFYLNNGMLYVRHETEDLRAHIVVADLEHEQLDVQVALAPTPGSRNGLLTRLAENTGAFVAINGDFYTDNYMPQNLTVIDNEIVTAPQFRATFALQENHEPFIGYFTESTTWDGSIVAENEAWLPLQFANITCEAEWLCMFTDIWQELPLREGYDGIRVLVSPENEVLSIERNEPMGIPEGHVVLRAGIDTEAGKWLEDNLAIGETVEINTTTTPTWSDFEYAISGGPVIVKNGRFWQDCNMEIDEADRICESFTIDFHISHYNRALIPRSAIGYNRDNQALILIMVEGNGVHDSKGIRQDDLAAMFIRLGAYAAMEFDGGRSAILWINQNPVNGYIPTDERHIPNALLLFWNEE